ncbi:MAG: ABC transporter substrate-binding protein [Eubacteriales bacterium]|nr:ABC transporter substrate-binding protein [Eubacteriales bacterium]
MKKKSISILMAAAIVASLTAGNLQVAEAAKKDEQVTVSVWSWDSPYFEALKSAYEAEHPEVKLELTAVEWGDMQPKVQQALASGSELPVVLVMDNIIIDNWKKMDICEDLAAYGFDKSEYVESLADQAVTEDGTVVGVEINVCPAGIAYKRDLAKEYFGTDDPNELSEIFNSYDAYAEKGAEVYEKSNGEVYLFHSGQAVAEWLYFADDTPVMSGDTLNYTEKMTNIMSVLTKMRDANAVDSYQNGTPEANATYADDTHIFYPCPSWSPSYYIQGNDPDGAGNWGIMHAPADYIHGGAAAGITKMSSDEQKKAAYDFLIWSTQGEGATLARDAVGYITPYKKLMNDPEWVKASDDMIEFFGGEDIANLYYQEIAPNTKMAVPSRCDSVFVNVRSDLAQLLMNDKEMTLDDAVNTGKEQITQLITDDSVTIE